MNDFISNETTRLLARSLDGLHQRHQAFASNIANAETPGYKTKDVAFEANLKQALSVERHQADANAVHANRLKTGSDKHINPKAAFKSGQGGMIERTLFDYQTTGDGVDIESQMAFLSKNTGKYSAVAKIEGRMFNSLRSVIKSGGG